ncbi:MAG: DUF3307 domain-containing protein [Hyphomicrobiaceae bacterium]
MLELSTINQVAVLLVTHWVGDFLLQTSWMATQKSRNLNALLAHVVTYTIVLSVAAVVLFGQTETAGWFIIANAALHLVTDFLTSRVSAKYYDAKNMRAFFVMVGLDQLFHLLALVYTLQYFAR